MPNSHRLPLYACDCEGRQVCPVGNSHQYVDADAEGYDGAYRVKDEPGISWRVFGWEMEPTEDTDWDGVFVRTGALVLVMIGDDRPFTYDPDDIEPLDRESYCGVCGQIGCTHDGLERE